MLLNMKSCLSKVLQYTSSSATTSIFPYAITLKGERPTNINLNNMFVAGASILYTSDNVMQSGASIMLSSDTQNITPEMYMMSSPIPSLTHITTNVGQPSKDYIWLLSVTLQNTNNVPINVKSIGVISYGLLLDVFNTDITINPNQIITVNYEI